MARESELDYHRLGTVVIEVAAVINMRPIAVKFKSKTDYKTLCPPDILLGRLHSQWPRYQVEAHLQEDHTILPTVGKQQVVVKERTNQWLSQTLPEMTPRQAWNQKFRSVEEGYM